MPLPSAELTSRLRGVYTATVTPFENGEFDEAAYRKLVEFQIDRGVDGLVPVGTTGECPTLSFEEHIRVIRVCVETARGRVPVVAGTGANSTSEALELSHAAKDAGADGLLVVAPYYNRPTQRGLTLHFRALLEQVRMPLVLYNIPVRTGVKVEPETMAAIAEAGNLAGVKEAAGSCDDVCRIIEVMGPDFPVMSGDDSLTLPFMAVGARGVVSTSSNVVPGEMGDMVRAFAEGRAAEALALHRKLYPLMRGLFIESNPGPVKYAMSLLGMCSGELRLPMAPPSDAAAAMIREALVKCGFEV